MVRIALSLLFLSLFHLSSGWAFSPDEFAPLKDRQALKWRGTVVDLNQMMAYYASGSMKPVWVSGTQVTERGKALHDSILRAHEDGLEAADYLTAPLKQLPIIENTQDALGFELAMSQAYLAFMRDLHSGRSTPAVTSPDIVIARKKVDAPRWLLMVAQSGVKASIDSLVPQHPQYFQLRQYLAGYRALAARGGWKAVRRGEVLKPDQSSDHVVDLRNNLKARGYSGIDGAVPALYDGDLVPVVKHFQKRHGLDADGVVGPATLAALNVSAQDRVRQIIVNMERWRWLPSDLGERHVFVNQAAFEMFTIDKGKAIDRRRVIVGKPFHKTPIFSDTIEYAEFNPIWTVPRSIATKEMLKKLRNDPSFTERGNYSIYKGSSKINPYAVDWSAVNASSWRYKIVQEPGPKNALGQVKFIFPNKFSVYLHDTPSRSLFSRTSRAFSHGCIRVHKPLEYAALLFGMDQKISRKRVDNIIDSRERKRISFKRQVPVHLTYFSVWIDDNGVPSFFNDVYERDTMVGNIIFGNV